MKTLTARVSATAVGVLLGTLLLVGVASGLLLHVQNVRVLDRALLEAAYRGVVPTEPYVNHFVGRHIRVRPWEEGDPLVDEQTARTAEKGERPLWLDVDRHRVLVLLLEPEGEPLHHDHRLVVADAIRPTMWETVGTFWGVYALVSLAASVLAAGVVRWGMARALRPVDTASSQLHRVQDLGNHARVPMSGIDEIDGLMGSVNELLGRLERAFDAQSSFTAQAAHELRTPVTVLKGELELALRRPRDEASYRETLGRAASKVEELADLVDALMALARIDAGQAERGREREHVSAAVNQALARESERLATAGCEVQVSLADDPELAMHVGLVATAVANLLRNVAVHAPGASVRLSVGRDGDRVLVQVDDDGPGLDEADRVRVLERFARVGQRDGLGLGLSLAREVARRHGGDLTLGEAPAGGLRTELALRLG